MDTQLVFMLSAIGFRALTFLVSKKIRLIFRHCILRPNRECTLVFKGNELQDH